MENREIENYIYLAESKSFSGMQKQEIYLRIGNRWLIYICDAIREKGHTIQTWKFTRRAIEQIKVALNAFKDSFLMIHILQNNVDKKFLFAPHGRSVQKLIESRKIRKSIFWIVVPFLGSRQMCKKICLYEYDGWMLT